MGEDGGVSAAFGAAGEAAMKAKKFIVDFTKESLKAYAEQERADRQLKLVAGELTETFKRQAAAMQESLGVSDDMVQGLQTLQLRFGQAPADVEKTTRAILDYAAATGKDATSAMEMLTRASANGGQGLARMGIEIEGTADKTENLRRATDALAKKFGGAAEADANSLAGQIRIAEAAIGELKEGFGQMIVEFAQKTGAIDKATAAIKALSFAFSDEKKMMEESNKRTERRIALVQELTLVEGNLKALANMRTSDPSGYTEYLKGNEAAFANGVLTPGQQSDRARELRRQLAALDKEQASSDKDRIGPTLSGDAGLGDAFNFGSDGDKAKTPKVRAAEDEGEKLAKAYEKNNAELKRIEEQRAKDERHALEQSEKDHEHWLDLMEAADERNLKDREEADKAHLAQLKKTSDDRVRMMKQEAKALEDTQASFMHAGNMIGQAVLTGIQTALSGEATETDEGEKVDAVYAGAFELMSAVGVAAASYWGGPLAGAAASQASDFQRDYVYKSNKYGTNPSGKNKNREVRQMKFHDGGWVERFHSGGWPGMSTEETATVLQRGERVVSRAETARAGGPAAVDKALKGGSGGGMNITIHSMDAKSVQSLMEDDGGRGMIRSVKSGRGELAHLLREG